jgi:hypothetical protein
MVNLRTAMGRALSPGIRSAAIRVERWATAHAGLRPIVPMARRMLLPRHLRRPEEVDIEVTSSCDADCIMCPRKSMRRSPGPMPFPLFRAVVDEAVSLGVRDLVLNGYGEIATLRNSAEYIGYIRRRSASIRILVNTNGMRLTRELAAAFIEHGVDIVNVTIDGATAETYEAIRKHLKLDVVEENVRRLIAMRNALGRKRPYIMTHMICMPENEHEIDAFIKKWTGVSDHVGGAGLYSRGGSVKGRPQTPDWSLPCFLLWRQMPILSDGSVAMCCDDWDGAMSPGNVADGGIRAIWTSPRMQELRRIQLEGRAVTNPLCAGCQTPRRPPWWFTS